MNNIAINHLFYTNMKGVKDIERDRETTELSVLGVLGFL